MSRLPGLPVACVLLVLVFAAHAPAQNSSPKAPAKRLVGILLDSNYVRLDEFVPRLQDYLGKNVPPRMKTVELLPLDASKGDQFEAARNANCDYLLQMTILESNHPAVGVA